jgi:hypothetical protein
MSPSGFSPPDISKPSVRGKPVNGCGNAGFNLEPACKVLTEDYDAIIRKRKKSFLSN